MIFWTFLQNSTTKVEIIKWVVTFMIGFLTGMVRYLKATPGLLQLYCCNNV